MKDNKRRLDQVLVMRGDAISRAKAQALIMSGNVKVNGKVIDKCGALINEDAVIEVMKSERFVSRGGEKLAGALKDFNFSVFDKTALDIGASTGGFTDCLIRNGAKKVYAVDVGHGQMDAKLRKNDKVIVIEKFNARYLSEAVIPERIDLVTIDVSFISIKKILPALDRIKFSGHVLALIKPQFEAGVKYVRKGVVRDENVINKIIDDIKSFAIKLGYQVIGVKPSVLKGPKGNTEYFILLERRIET
jgi:23S rRNA (cytidine1920-2'-O)/16S rRNA (cytidine1409-2'-O)-methyltransferase